MSEDDKSKGSPEEPEKLVVAASDEPIETKPVEEDLASPDAIAKRVAFLGEEDETERMARVEEEKLAERRAKQKGTGKRGLEAAASKRLAKVRDKSSEDLERARSQGRGPSRAVPNDPLLQKTNELGKWASKNKSVVAGVVAAAVLVIGGFTLREYLGQRKETQASEILADAVAAQRGRIGTPGTDDAEKEGFRDPTPMFKTIPERQDAALAKYRDVQQRFPGTGAAFLARLSEGSILLDKRQPDLAIAAYSDARSSPLATADAEVRGRSLEGLGFAYELKAQGGDAAKLDDALKVFRELENTDVKGFKELGMYHQARVHEAKGDKDKAKELLKSVRERVNKPGEGHPFPYLENVAEDRLRALDPTALPPKSPMNVGGGGAGNKMSEAQMRKMMEQIQKQMKEQQEKKEHP